MLGYFVWMCGRVCLVLLVLVGLLVNTRAAVGRGIVSDPSSGDVLGGRARGGSAKQHCVTVTSIIGYQAV